MSTKFATSALADELIEQSERDAAVTSMDAVLEAARAGTFTADQCFRLLARMWTLKRLMYYVYGGWAQGINLNEYPPSVAYLFGKQIYDESTHEMQFCDEILRRRWARTQKQLFAHPYSRFGTATRTGAYIFCLRALANYPQNVRIAALNLGPKVIELAWTGSFANSFPDESIHALFISPTSQHFLEIDERCTYPKCTVCLMYCPSEGSIVEADTGQSLVPPPPEVWTENRRWRRQP